jgi:hypothetical protein
VKGDDPFPESFCPVGALGNDDIQLVGKRENAAIEKLVVRCAESEPVEFLVRAAGVVPLDMCRLQSHGNRSQADVEVADRAAVFVGAQHALAEIQPAWRPAGMARFLDPVAFRVISVRPQEGIGASNARPPASRVPERSA